MQAAVFTSGMATLAVEMGASRLMGSVFGSSNLVWANVIGLMLLYLTAGYFLGGRWADHDPRLVTFYRILIAGSFLAALTPLVARPVLSAAAAAVVGLDGGVAVGAFVGVLALFALPITLLGMVSPFAIRLLMSEISASGRAAGRLYAISTLGSIVGTFLPVLYVIPEFGTTATFLIFTGILYIVGLIGHISVAGWRNSLVLLLLPVIVIGLTLVVSGAPLRQPLPGAVLLYEDESAYNYIQVQEAQDGTRYLYLNEGQGIHSEWHPTRLGLGRTWDFFLVAPYFAPANPSPVVPEDVRSLAIVGFAGGTIARQYSEVYGRIPIDGWEIDPGIVAAARTYFGMGASELPNVQIFVEDGRFGLNRSQNRYSVIALDAYRPPYIPWHLTTVEFFQQARAHLLPRGVVAINVGRTPDDRRLVEALTATLRQVFPTVHAIDVPRSFNTILIATQETSQLSDFVAAYDSLPASAHPLLRQTFTLALNGLVEARASDVIFTDERAPVETITDSLVLNFLLTGGTEQLR